MIVAALLSAAMVLSPPPRQLQVSSARGVHRIALRLEPGLGALVPLPPLARAVGGTIEVGGAPWLTWRTPVGRFRFLVGTPILDDGNGPRPLPAPSMARGDTLFVPLAFVAEVLADPARKGWTWNPSSATLAEGATVSPLVARPEPAQPQPVATTNTESAGSGLRRGHRVTIDPGHGGTDPGNPDVCNVYSMHKIFSSGEEVEMVNVECRRAGIGCVDCKKLLARNLNQHLEPFRLKRAELASHPDDVQDVLKDGGKRARLIAQKTMEEVREAIQLP